MNWKISILWTLLFGILCSPANMLAQSLASATPAIVIFPEKLDANRLTQQSDIQVILTEAVRLSDNTKLNYGTRLNVHITKVMTYTDGHVGLEIAFKNAVLKHGSVLPLKATILDVGTKEMPMDSNPELSEVPMVLPRDLQHYPDNARKVDITPGVDLHCESHSDNSGIFVATTFAQIRFPVGTKMLLALTPAK